MSPPDAILWLGPPEPWAAALGPAVHVADGPEAVAATTAADAALVVVDGAHLADVAPWLRRPRLRPPALVLTDDPEVEAAALEAGAEDVLARDGDPEAALRALRRVRARARGVARRASLFEVMVESATDLIGVLDAEGGVIYANPAVQDVLGASPEAVVGRRAFDFVHPDDADTVEAFFARRVRGADDAGPVRFRVRAADGGVRVLEGVSRAVRRRGGEVVGVVCVRDVTEDEETTLRLRASEARFRAVVEALPDVVSRIRHDGLVLDFHVPAVFETEFPAEAMIGNRLQDLIPDELAEKFERAVAQMTATGAGVSYDYTVEVGGAVKYREVRLAPMEGEMISMIRDVTALREHEAALERSRIELRALAAHLQSVREEERTRLSREVHDVLGQALTAVRLGVGWFARRFPDDEAAQARVADTRAVIDETLGHVRQIAADLRPGVLDDFGLRSAVEWEAARFEERTGLACVVEVEGAIEPPPDVATAAFRVLQEALTNVARHAEAEVVDVALTLAPGAVRLVVADDGRGFAPAPGRRSLGLLGMRERARAVGGTVAVHGELGRGTRVEAIFPLSTDSP